MNLILVVNKGELRHLCLDGGHEDWCRDRQGYLLGVQAVTCDMFQVQIATEDGGWQTIAVFGQRDVAEKFADNFSSSHVEPIALNPDQMDLIRAVSRFEIKMDKLGNVEYSMRDDDEFDDVKAEDFFDKYEVVNGTVIARVSGSTKADALRKVHEWRMNAIALGSL